MPTHYDNYPDRSINRIVHVMDLFRNLKELQDLENNPDFSKYRVSLEKIICKQGSILGEIREFLMTGHYSHEYIKEKLTQIEHCSEHLSRIIENNQDYQLIKVNKSDLSKGIYNIID